MASASFELIIKSEGFKEHLKQIDKMLKLTAKSSEKYIKEQLGE